MKRIITLFFMILALLSCFSLTAVGEPDVKGSKEHPLLTRMPDFYISGYKYNDYDSHKFIDQDKKQVVVEGSKYYIEYKLNKGATEPGELKIRRNIQDALKKIGGKVIFDDNFNKCSTIVVEKDGSETWIDVRSYNPMYRLTTITKKVMEQEVVATAEVMGNDINSTGHVSIYGIYFDTGKADIKPESDAAIAEIAKLLQNNPSLKVYVVGHTDSDGSFDLNMKLSRDRAEAVTRTLISKHGIASDRLKSHGVSSLAPVASNDTEEGKQKNRRVELVKQ
ncbi:MAG: OmpA family protein [Deltaproteobacteria bacterium]|nr:OmpA family protein [Deltaproteobacteria bacterium]